MIIWNRSQAEYRCYCIRPKNELRNKYAFDVSRTIGSRAFDECAGSELAAIRRGNEILP